MGLIECGYHGDSGMVHVCSHLKKDIRNRTPSEIVITATFPKPPEVPNPSQWDLLLHYCSKCAGEYGFPNETKAYPRDQFNAFYNNDIFGPACYRCFAELNAIGK